jgi:hypothetical protein
MPTRVSDVAVCREEGNECRVEMVLMSKSTLDPIRWKKRKSAVESASVSRYLAGRYAWGKCLSEIQALFRLQ